MDRKYTLHLDDRITQDLVTSHLPYAIVEYYMKRGLKWPTSEYEAMAWATTEIAEAYELLLAREGGWVRNNPEDKEAYSEDKFCEELGDAIMMLVVAGLIAGGDPILELRCKMQRKLYGDVVQERTDHCGNCSCVCGESNLDQ